MNSEEIEGTSTGPSTGTSGQSGAQVRGVLTGQVQMHTPEFPECDRHIEVQHRDGLPPWCHTCGWNRGRPAGAARQIKQIG